jgi:hypothetical protein
LTLLLPKASKISNGIEDFKNVLKGQSHKKVGEIRAQGDSLGPNKEQLLLFKIF